MNMCAIYVRQLTCIKMFISHTGLREPEKFSDLPVVTQQVLVTTQVVNATEMFGSDRIVQQKDIGPRMGSTA